MLTAADSLGLASLIPLHGVISLMITNVPTLEEFTPIQRNVFGSDVAVTSAWADYDGDGDLDLAVVTKTGEVRLYRSDDGKFANIGPQLGLPTSSSIIDDYPAGLAWGDFDGDGDLDLYVGTSMRPILGRVQLARNYLYRNDGARGLSEVAKQVGVDVPGANTRQVSWIDYDSDGDLDLFVAGRAGYSRLFRNDNSHFQDVSAETGVFNSRRTVGACWFDMDQDGDLDLFLANQDGDKDSLYRNDHGKFTDVAAEQKMDQPQRTGAEGGVGCSVGDFDNDGDLDLFVASYGDNLLYRNDGTGQFEEVARQFGITGSVHAVGASWGDHNNDGYLDLFVTGYENSEPTRSAHPRFFHNEGTGFVEVLKNSRTLIAADHGVQWADYDRDGDLDLALTNHFGVQRGHLIWRNELPERQRRNSLQVMVLDANGNYTRAGSEVRLFDNQNKLISTRLVPTGDGYDSQSAVPVHFGLSQVKRVTVEVVFHTPAGRRKQRLYGIDPRRWAGKVLIVKQDQLQ